MPFVVAIIVFGVIALLIYIISQRKQTKYNIDDLYDEISLLKNEVNELRIQLGKDPDKISLNF